ncbi:MULTISPECIES: 2-dehydropantoate 2-reductase [Pseudomonas]|uniref:2-dehydropantoate 2-reductase n=1 Tax=Pseudomonas neustonica TaxID=2487346 RepID=A0ABX9XND4_9PSED|nr:MULTISPECIES: 2-dehydropantoate 2-reductase [Pseudomonas]MBA6418519.1 2-dehydropantoate 2-reductase [Pseudomonas sp. 5Ae-yellow]ROZ84969.1 2-dehydropantoate 2-reductase [Pseudomonas sp. SSM44]ROZ86744.1 2-dehydropantoate 2-reductase [Pseudomonas neustonica]|tara:strand:- start:36061 stop:36972 length:912 start_codon:yes stop_codon:yes gene_type:complete
MVHVLGAGSLGLLWIARLQQANQSCCLLLRNSSALTQWQNNSNQLIFEHHGARRVLPVTTEIASQSTGPIDIVVVATKAYAVISALESIRHRLNPGSQILLLQNGLGAQQEVSAAFAQQRVLYASVTDGAWQPSPQHLVWAGQGKTVIGDPDQQPPPPWLERITSSIEWQWDNDILAVLWRKLAINCAINPFTLLFDCVNGAVPSRAGDWLDRCIEELQLLLAAQGVADTNELAKQIHDVIQRTASNSSSMRQDLRAKRRTELDYILGYACRQAQQRNIAVPALTRLLQATRQCLADKNLPVD